MKRLTMITTLAVAAVLLTMSSVNATPNVQYLAYYYDGVITYECFNGPPNATIIVDAVVENQVSIDPANPVDLLTDGLGNATGTVDVDTCNSIFLGPGSVTISMTLQSTSTLVFKKTINLQCVTGGDPPVAVGTVEYATRVPTMSQWGLITLLAMLIVSASWVLWRRREHSTA